MRGFLLISSVSFGFAISCPAGPLDEYQWKSRIIVFDFSSEDVETLRGLEDEIRKTKAEWKGRDLKFFHAGEVKRSGSSYVSRLTENQRVALRKRLGFESSRGPSLTLLGKDGRVKSQQKGAFSLKKFYDLIDTMPMRRREMQQR